MKQGVYFAYSKPVVTFYDDFGNIETQEDLQSRYQELYAVKENIAVRTAFNVGDEIIYDCRIRYTHSTTNVTFEEWINYRHIATDNANDLKRCLYLASYSNSSSGYRLLCAKPTSGFGGTTYMLNTETGNISESTNQSFTTVEPGIYMGTTSRYPRYETVYFNTNIPVFATLDLANQYINGTIGIESALNYNSSWNPDTESWQESEPFQSGLVAFYRQSGVYDLQLISDVDIDKIRYSTDGTNWTESDSIQWQSFISPNEHEVDNYSYKSLYWQTNIPIFGNLQDASGYIGGSVPITDADNYDDLSDESDKDVALGEVVDGEMDLNETSLRGAFCSRYAVNISTLANITNAFFTDDETIFQNLIDGLSLYGQTPMDSIIDLTYYPFNVLDYVTSSSQNYIYFGRYQLNLENATNKIINLNTVIDCGSVAFPVTYGDYKDYEPYTELYAYLPYCGLQKLNIVDYIGKTMGVKYGVDITTGACECFVTSDGKIINRFVGQMGVRQFITSMDSATYTSNVTNSIVNGATDFGASAISTVGSVASGNVMGAVIGGGGALINGIKGIANFKGAVENVPYKTSGSATSMLNQFDIQYPFFMFIYSKVYPCDDINIVGKPTNTKGQIRNFSGFLKCSDVKIESDCTQQELAKIEQLCLQGIYI